MILTVVGIPMVGKLWASLTVASRVEMLSEILMVAEKAERSKAAERAEMLLEISKAALTVAMLSEISMVV